MEEKRVFTPEIPQTNSIPPFLRRLESITFQTLRTKTGSMCYVYGLARQPNVLLCSNNGHVMENDTRQDNWRLGHRQSGQHARRLHGFFF
jgi:hypothetical protein